MREVGKKLRHLGFAAVFAPAASGASAQLQEFSTGQRNLAGGSPAAIGDGWLTAGGRQIVSVKWIEQSATPRFRAIDYFGDLPTSLFLTSVTTTRDYSAGKP
ncbi:hypothetical protein [Bradyrhizobium retamae]|uniref:Uncharacterized protein n=1 Tax=Bradyrhizobium retamae TaxID=1300035 RepID=A0A0R3NCJ6_9BRAD|nr:hypothetical protein [Bradyrhizobium retamae]KRR30052.1 hypothetical protein CQ13_14780 [Bradyrhizobium retamae]